MLLYNRATREKNPMACIELKNTTGLTLEGGPVTVMDADTYVGEAMLDTMKPEDRRFVPYAVELGCVVSVEDHAEEGPVRRAVVNRGVLLVEFFHVRRTHYQVRNKSPRAQTLYLEHPRSGWQLEDTAAPDETTDNFWRFQRALAPGATLDFAVRETTRGQRSWALTNVGPDDVGVFLSSGFIDERVAQGMREVAALREKLAQLTEDERQRYEERTQLFEDQKRIRANIDSLKSGGTQRELAERFVAKLNVQEDRLEALVRELETLAQGKREAQEAVNRILQSLAFSAQLGEPRG